LFGEFGVRQLLAYERNKWRIYINRHGQILEMVQ
jgi:hypothetical protein